MLRVTGDSWIREAGAARGTKRNVDGSAKAA
jgi:hypothetical protein